MSINERGKFELLSQGEVLNQMTGYFCSLAFATRDVQKSDVAVHQAQWEPILKFVETL